MIEADVPMVDELLGFARGTSLLSFLQEGLDNPLGRFFGKGRVPEALLLSLLSWSGVAYEDGHPAIYPKNSGGLTVDAVALSDRSHGNELHRSGQVFDFKSSGSLFQEPLVHLQRIVLGY